MTRRRNILLVADDYGMTDGVSDGIARLAEAGRLSATSALVTLPRWARDAPRLAGLRGLIVPGLHLNLTLGVPLGSMPRLAPDGGFPDIGALVRGALLRRIDRAEVEHEFVRQIDRFRDAAGYLPEMIDGHQHAHALPIVRDALIRAIAATYTAGSPPPLVRVPTDPHAALVRRGQRAPGKRLTLTALAAGVRAALDRAGIPRNDTFAGVTNFNASEDAVARDFGAAAAGGGALHLVMCHPGITTPELSALDPVTRRRDLELAYLERDNALSARLWQVRRDSLDSAIDWHTERAKLI